MAIQQTNSEMMASVPPAEKKKPKRSRLPRDPKPNSRKRKPLQFSKYGRMVYHPDWHYRHRKRMTVAELAYIVQSYARGDVKALALDIGRTCKTVRTSANNVRRLGLWDSYLTIDTSKFLDQLAEDEEKFLKRTGFHAITDDI